MYDLGIIGAGPAGYTAALCARKKGLSVVLFEKDLVGGVCLNRGCIPTKAILHAAQTGATFEQAMAYKDEVVAKVRKGLELTLKNAGVEVVHKQINDPSECDCAEIIAATGSKPRELPQLPFDHKKVLSSDDVLNLKTLPKSVTIVGSGAIGTEWARIFAAFGSDVTVIEAAERLLPIADVEVSKRLERIFKSAGIKFQTSCTDIPDAEVILVAIGRNPRLTPHASRLIGDACGEMQLAHFASKQAMEIVGGVKFDKTLVPSVVYGTPEIAWVGAREQDLEPGTFQKSNLLISALGKSHCDGCTDGFIKILARDGKIIGAHIVSKEASGLIQQIVIAMQFGIGVEQLKEVCFAHPTYSEGIFECLMRL
jgi:dihydrolipoamide dehydrogenase